jgi:hypothetical protein
LQAQDQVAECMRTALERPNGKIQLSLTPGRNRYGWQIGHRLESVRQLVAQRSLHPQSGAIVENQPDRVFDVERETRRQLAPGAELRTSRDRAQI